MAELAADFEFLYLDEKFSNMCIIIREDDGRKRKRNEPEHMEVVLPGHNVVLMGFSPFCKAKLESWSDPAEGSNTSSNSGTSKPSIEFSVPVGQLEIGQLLVKGMYQRAPRFTDLDTTQLLQLLLLADRYQVAKVQAAAVAGLEALPAAQWPWETVLAVLTLPASCAQQDSCKPVLQFAVQRLQQQLGDLELVWADEQLQQQLLELPFELLLQLLQSDETRVASEHTVMYTIKRWYEQQPQAARRVAQLKQLMQQVRMQHCSQLYITTCMMQDKLVRQCFTAEELGFASACSTSANMLKDLECSVLDKYPAWIAPKRPLSRRDQSLIWHVPLSELQPLVEQHLQDRAAVFCTSSKPAVLQGRSLQLRLDVESADNSSSDSSTVSRTLIGVFLDATNLTQDAVCRIRYKCTVGTGGGQSNVVKGPYYGGFSARYGRGFEFIIFNGAVSSWEGVKAVLRDKGLIHPDHCLHLRFDILATL